LNFDELRFNDKAQYFYYMAHNLICGYCLDKADCILALEIGHLVFNVSDHSKAVQTKLELGVNVNMV
jgi:hypothetical protein